FALASSPRTTTLRLHEVASGRAVAATTGDFRDYAPAFDPEGRYLYFLSARTFDPVYDSVHFDLSFPRATRPYLIALQAHGAPPFDPAPRGLAPREDKPTATAPVSVRIDAAGLATRVAAFPVPEGVYRQVAGLHGKVLWTVFEPLGAHGRGGLGGERPGRLECFDFASVHRETLLERIDSFSLSRDARTMVMREGRKLRALEAGKKPDAKGAEGYPEHSRQAGWIDLERIRASVNPVAEWKQMLREVARLQRDQFWVADMSGVDWQAAVRRYEALLPKVATRAELSHLIWEMQGELGTSHAYEMLGDHRRPPAWTLGALAADFRGDEITHIARGDSWDAAADSPLNAIGVEAQVGERIVAVNGQPVTRERPVSSLLVHQAGAKVELTLARGEKRRSALATLLKDEVPARYRDWVETKRRWVHEQSQGRVGYLHLPDMMS